VRNNCPPEVTVVIPTRNRPEKLLRAVESALSQSLHDLEVIVVDDGATLPVELPPNPRLRCIRLESSQGPAAARNAGLAAARGRFVTFLDDDDSLLPHMAEASLKAIAETDLPSPVAVISGIEVIDGTGAILERRVPPTSVRGQHFSLEPLPAGRSYVTKNTLVVEREVMLSLGGFDTSLAACEWIDLFLRLNPACSLLGLSTVTYRLTRDAGYHFSRDTRKRHRGFRQLIDKHRDLLAAHPEGYADAILGEARMALASGAFLTAMRNIAAAVWIAPCHAITTLTRPMRAIRAIRDLRTSG